MKPQMMRRQTGDPFNPGRDERKREEGKIICLPLKRVFWGCLGIGGYDRCTYDTNDPS